MSSLSPTRRASTTPVQVYGLPPGSVYGRVYRQVDELLEDWPWTMRDLQNLTLRTALGLALIVAGYLGASSSAEWREQLIWIGAGLAGTMVAAAAGVGWLLNGLAVISRERSAMKRAMIDRLESRLQLDDDAASTTASISSTQVLGDGLVTAAGMKHYHRVDCQVASGKPVESISFAQAMARELTPCGMCRP